MNFKQLYDVYRNMLVDHVSYEEIKEAIWQCDDIEVMVLMITISGFSRSVGRP